MKDGGISGADRTNSHWPEADLFPLFGVHPCRDLNLSCWAGIVPEDPSL